MRRWTRCKLCGSVDLRPLYDLPRVEVQVVACRSCGFAFVDLLYDEETAAQLYTRELTREVEYERYEAQKEARAAERVREIADRLVGRGAGSDAGSRLATRPGACGERLDGLTVLDVGAGGGCFLDLVRRAGAQAVGIELSGSARAFALDRYGISLSPRSLADPFWGSLSADVVTLWDVVEHVQDPVAVLGSAARALKPGGLLALTTPARDCSVHAAAVALYRATGGRAAGLLGRHYNWLHLQVFRTRDLIRVLSDQGIRVVRMRKLLDLTYPPAWYFREAIGKTNGGQLRATLARLCLLVLPLKNKILMHGVRVAS